MRIDPLSLLLALVLLWIPTALFIGRRRRHNLCVSDRRRTGVTFLGLLYSVWTWVDLTRAGLGAWVLANLAVLPPLPTEPSSGTGRHLCTVIVLGVLFLGVWSQTMLTGSRHLRLAPLGYLVGIAAAMLPWQIAVFGIMLGLCLTGMTGYWILSFWILPITLGAFVALFRQLGLINILVPPLFLIPAIMGVRPNFPLSWIYARTAETLPVSAIARPPHRELRKSSH